MPSLKVPVAVICRVCATWMMVVPAGVTAIELRVAVVEVRVVDPDLPLMVAEMVVPPVAVEVTVARPFEPDAFEMVATVVADEAQLTEVVMFWLVPSL